MLLYENDDIISTDQVLQMIASVEEFFLKIVCYKLQEILNYRKYSSAEEESPDSMWSRACGMGACESREGVIFRRKGQQKDTAFSVASLM